MPHTHLKTVVGAKQGHAPCTMFPLKQSLFLCQFYFLRIIRLSQHWGESGHPQLPGILSDLRRWCLSTHACRPFGIGCQDMRTIFNVTPVTILLGCLVVAIICRVVLDRHVEMSSGCRYVVKVCWMWSRWAECGFGHGWLWFFRDRHYTLSFRKLTMPVEVNLATHDCWI